MHTLFEQDEEFVLALLLITVQYGEDEKSAETAKKKKKKDIRDYSDAEMEEPQWEVRLQQTTMTHNAGD